MQPAQITFESLLLAHLAGDFLLQPSWLVRNKGRQTSALLLHGLVHYLLAWAALLAFAPITAGSWRNQLIVLIYAALHIAIDRLKCALAARNSPRDSWVLFSADQLVHLAVLAVATVLLARIGWSAAIAAFALAPETRIRVLGVGIVYLAVVFGGGYFIRAVTRGLAPGASGASLQLGNAGLYIGWIERFLIITAIGMQSPALVGLILTGKSIARLPEFKEARFAEYFLIGTLLSMLLSVVGGIILLYLLFGTVALK